MFRFLLTVQPAVVLCLTAFFAVLLSLLFSRGELVYGNDASLYISVANSLATGEGLRTNVVAPERDSTPPLVTVWPPAFPAVQAAFIAIGVPG